jgi:integrase
LYSPALELEISSHADDSSWPKLKSLVLNGLSPATKRLYAGALDQFRDWFSLELRPALTRAVVQEHKTWLQSKGYAPSTIAVRLSSIRKLVSEAVENGLMDRQSAEAILRIKGPRRHGRRLGNWLNESQADAFICKAELDTLKGKRDTAMFAVAIGCGLRRGEVASLTVEHFQLRDERWVTVDLVGKHNRIRSIPVPSWVKDRIDTLLAAAGTHNGFVFRAIDKADHVVGRSLTAQAIYEITRTHALRMGLRIAPHDLRRTFAKLTYAASAPVEQIQFTLGHTSITTTERYLGLSQDLRHAPGDLIRISTSGRRSV